MSGQQQAAEADAEAEPTTLGYCLQCDGYGRGVYAGTLNSHSDAIRDHEKCPQAGREYVKESPGPRS